jgi:hypothetical protein
VAATLHSRIDGAVCDCNGDAPLPETDGVIDLVQ